jgi:pantoate--beta-alanine ligase
MHDFTDPFALRGWLSGARSQGARIGLVPTMGALHEGHLALVDEARRRSEVVVLSVFVNPLQFGPSEDFARYPRDLVRDRAAASARGVAALFSPPVEVMYPAGSGVRVAPGPAAERWEGAVRPGHFAGVLTVVAKLFNIIQPHVAVFGQKDIQQATLISQMVRDLDFPLAVVLVPIVREADGLALSSRNAFLSPEQRRQGLVLSRGLRAADAAWRMGERGARRLTQVMQAQFQSVPEVTIDYIAVVEPGQLEPVSEAVVGTIIAVAGRVGSTRLLDNHILGTEFR